MKLKLFLSLVFFFAISKNGGVIKTTMGKDLVIENGGVLDLVNGEICEKGSVK